MTGRDDALWTRDAVSLAALIAEGTVTAAQVVEAHLERIEHVDSEIGAFTTVFAETARAEAAAADRRAPTGPLHGRKSRAIRAQRYIKQVIHDHQLQVGHVGEKLHRAHKTGIRRKRRRDRH